MKRKLFLTKLLLLTILTITLTGCNDFSIGIKEDEPIDVKWENSGISADDMPEFDDFNNAFSEKANNIKAETNDPHLVLAIGSIRYFPIKDENSYFVIKEYAFDMANNTELSEIYLFKDGEKTLIDWNENHGYDYPACSDGNFLYYPTSGGDIRKLDSQGNGTILPYEPPVIEDYVTDRRVFGSGKCLIDIFYFEEKVNIILLKSGDIITTIDLEDFISYDENEVRFMENGKETGFDTTTLKKT